MSHITQVGIDALGDYASHLKKLSQEDKYSRFGTNMSDQGIDALILQMLYNSQDHKLWVAVDMHHGVQGWGHMAKDGDSWELAVSVEASAQRKGVGNKLIKEMLDWAKFHKIDEVYMHCIENNKVIQHLAKKNKLQTKERGCGERVAAIEIPDPSILETQIQVFKEYQRLTDEMSELRLRLVSLMFGNMDTSHKEKKYVK